MPFRKYDIVCDNITMRQRLVRDKIRKPSLIEMDNRIDSRNRNYVLEVKKSPRAPQYEVHYQPARTEGIQAIHIRKRPKYTRKPPDGGPGTARSDDTDISSRLGSQVSDREKQLDMGGPRVLACYSADGLYYPAHVQKPSNAMYAVVLFNFKKRQKVKTKYLIPIGGAVPRPELAEGDFVLVRVYNQIRNLECYVPAIVEFLPEDQRNSQKFYSVLMFNGQRASTMRRYLVKIGKDRFAQAVEYIAQVQQYAEKHNKDLWLYPPSVARASTVRSDEGTITPRDSERHTESHTDGHTETDRSKKSTQRTSRSPTSSSASGSESKSSRTKSPSSSRSRSRSKSRSRSRSKSRSRSRSRSKSRSRSRSRSRSSRRRRRSGSRTGSSSSRSRSRSEMQTQNRPISRSSTGSQQKNKRDKRRSTFASELDHTRSRSSSPPPSPIERPSNPVPRPVHSRIDLQDMQNGDKDKIITELQYQLEKQTRRQLRQERRMVRQARKINKIQRKLKDTDLNESIQSDKSSHSEVGKRRKGSPDGNSHREITEPISDTSRLSVIDSHKEVLARWSDDGWYYHGQVIKEGKHKCIVQDATGYHEAISKEDIIIEADHNFDIIQPHDCVIGLHPNYIYSYAPGEVFKVSYSTAVTIEFYDGVVAELPKKEVFKIKRQKFNSVKDYILERERKLVGKSVVVRDDETGNYKLGVVDSKEREGQKYRVKWLDSTVSTQSAHHIFPVQRNNIHNKDWNYVLAPTEQPGGNILYKPAKVVLAKPLQVLFCDGTSSSSLKLNECFWISDDYYQNAEKYMLARN